MSDEFALPIVSLPPVFHDDSEVKWAELHHAAPEYAGVFDLYNMRAVGDSVLTGRCLACGHPTADDRYHLFFRVTPMSEQFEEVAMAYERFLHKKRHEISTRLTSAMISERMFGQFSDALQPIPSIQSAIKEPTE